MPQFLYRIRPTRPDMLTSDPTPTEEAYLGQHFHYLQQLTEAGIVLLAGRTLNTDESGFGIVIFKAASEADAWDVVRTDPAVANQVMQAELFPYRVALHNKEWTG